jgi:hypothetical protein
MEFISLAIIDLRSDRERAKATNQVYLNKTPDFQRKYEAWDEKLKTRFVESMLLGRAMNPIWTVLNEEDKSEEILDGMHRICTALSFRNNDFYIHENYLTTLDREKYKHKYLKDLDADDQARISSYNFIFNKLDSSYRKDLNKLKDMYEILNRSSQALNDYEFNKVLFNPFYEIINKVKPAFLRTNFFARKKDARGNIECEIIHMLVFADSLPSSWSTASSVQDSWMKSRLGDMAESVRNFVQNNGKELEDKLIFMTKIISDFFQRSLFCATSTKSLYTRYYLPYKFFVSRCVHKIPKYSNFNRHSANLIEQFLLLCPIDLTEEEIENPTLVWSCRNSVEQKKLIKLIDDIIDAELTENSSPRFFSKTMIEEKLQSQGHICVHCSCVIKEEDEYQGDHIVPWTAGGKTILENLQVLHKRCHQLK